MLVGSSLEIWILMDNVLPEDKVSSIGVEEVHAWVRSTEFAAHDTNQDRRLSRDELKIGLEQW